MGGDLQSIGGGVPWAEARSALAWWLEAGVDAPIQEQPRNWLEPAPAAIRDQPAAPAPAPEAPAHGTLPEFRQWIATSEHLPMASRAARRVLPHGSVQAAIMLLAEVPEDSTGPISGDAWELGKRMLAAINIEPEAAYRATLSFFHAPGARMSAADREALAEIARTHIRLAAPRRLLLLGDGPAQALLAKPLAQARGHVHKIEGVRSLATFHPRHLIKRPLDKRLAWQDLLLLMEDDS